ncbi:MAG: hypothetical protein C5B55_07385 [Blastocatellia bacterium]|nr:MAG: hypothetical protein C5B55_07385 [Blastocatellia bacterium]
MFMVENLKTPALSKMELITEKIATPSPTGSVHRQRLQLVLTENLRTCTSTIICGRAGTGKTVLATDFADRCGRAVAWYKVDAPDGELSIFFQYLLASIHQKRSGLRGRTVLPMLCDAQPERMPFLAEALVYELERATGPQLLIVIEDLHLVCDAEWLVPFFRRLLPLLPTDVHMLITSRTLPPAPLWRMRSKQTLSVIDEETLAFTREETVSLFEKYGLTREQANISFDHSHGRAAALSNLAASLRFAEEESEGSIIFNVPSPAEAV